MLQGTDVNVTSRPCDALKFPPLNAGSTCPKRYLVTSASAVQSSGGTALTNPHEVERDRSCTPCAGTIGCV